MQGIELAKAGQRDQARQLFQNAIRLDPQNETAWLWMSSVARDNRERLFCLKTLLQINPQNEMAIKGLRALNVDPAQVLQEHQAQERASQTGAPAVPVTVPALGREQVNAVVNAVDAFLRDYSAQPHDIDVEWQRKTSRRFGEALAFRRRNRRYVLMGAGGLAALLVLILGALLILRGGDAQLVAQRATLTPSFTPTNTATATPGVTNTPSPEPLRTDIPFAPPSGLPRGNIYNNTPTPVYPGLPPGLGREFANAVGLYSIGAYEDAFAVFQLERDRANQTGISCEPATYFYHVMGLAEIGGRRNLDDARALYEDALARPGCDESPMIYTAACVTDYLTFLEDGDVNLYSRAVQWCDAAIEEVRPDRPIPVSVTTRARLYLLEQPSNFRAAAAVLDEALAVWPADLNLLLVRARVEIQRGDLQQALLFISQALHVDPASEAALRLRVEAFLDIAALTEDENQRIQLYGTAVIWTQEYLIFYPGEADGYLLMARARYGEGNLDLAVEALTRIIEVRRSLPETEATADVIQRAYVLRAEIYKETARYDAALSDIETLLQDDPDNLVLIREQADLAYELERYALALEGTDALLNAGVGEPDQTMLLLRRLRLTTQICEFTIEIECDYENTLGVLTDDFIATLSEDDAIEARSYRAKAEYHVTMELDPDSVSQNQLTLAFQHALSDIEAVLAVNENPLDMYYRGLILEQLDNADEALLAYDWVAYWAQFYDYPFIEDVQARIEELRPPEDDEDST